MAIVVENYFSKTNTRCQTIVFQGFGEDLK